MGVGTLTVAIVRSRAIVSRIASSLSFELIEETFSLTRSRFEESHSIILIYSGSGRHLMSFRVFTIGYRNNSY
jgi:hypothetical protein